MAIIEDSIGAWQQIGTQLVTNEWKLFPETIVNCELFRFTYIVNWEDWKNLKGYRSFCLLRFYYSDFSNNAASIVTPIIKLYPKENREFRELVIPKHLKQGNNLLRDVGVKRVIYRRPIVNIPEAINWSLKIEATTTQIEVGSYEGIEQRLTSIESKIDAIETYGNQ